MYCDHNYSYNIDFMYAITIAIIIDFICHNYSYNNWFYICMCIIVHVCFYVQNYTCMIILVNDVETGSELE